MKNIACCCLLLLLSFSAAGQDNKPWAGFGIEANIMAGKVVKHTVNFRAPIPELSTAVELNLFQQTYGKNDWEQRRNYPVVGFGFGYTNFGIDSVYGQAFSIYPNLQVPLLRAGRFEWTMKIGFGLAYVTRHFERAPGWDTLNNAIGSHMNNYTLIATDLRCRLNEHMDIQAGAQLSHISNAALKTPNLGINMAGGHAGIRYFPITSNPQKLKRKLPPLRNRWLLQLRAGIAGNEYGQADGPLHPVYLFSAFASKRYLSKNKLLFGLDYSYHDGIYAFLRNNEIDPGDERKNSWKSSVFVGNEFLMGRMGILLQVGYYIKEAYLKLDPYYQKVGTNLYLVQKEEGPLKELSLGIFLKTHRIQAELVEVGIGAGF